MAHTFQINPAALAPAHAALRRELRELSMRRSQVMGALEAATGALCLPRSASALADCQCSAAQTCDRLHAALDHLVDALAAAAQRYESTEHEISTGFAATGGLAR